MRAALDVTWAHLLFSHRRHPPSRWGRTGAEKHALPPLHQIAIETLLGRKYLLIARTRLCRARARFPFPSLNGLALTWPVMK